MTYEPRLDGIRALAVLAVVGYHATSSLPGGWLGVDVFFVLSGFLITTLLTRELEHSGSVDFRSFYVKRLLRLGPALVVAVLLSIPLMLVTDADRSYSIPAVVAGVIGYVANWMQVADPTSLGPLTHTWSLAIEEQFYLIWPPVLVWILLRHGRAAAGRVALAGVLLVVLSRAALAQIVDGEHLWFATTSRADALLLGACVALWRPRVSNRQANGLLVVACGALGVLCLVAAEFGDAMLLGGLTVIASVSAALIVAAPHASWAAPLGWRPLVAIGRVSYGIYLYHYVVFYAANHWLELDGVASHAFKLAGTAALVVTSWFLIERPALSLKARLSTGEPAPTR